MKISELKERADNFRNHSESQIEEFIKSINMFGQIRPIVIDEDNNILAGHGLFAAMNKMGKKDVDVLVMKGLTEIEKKKLMLADNKIYELGTSNADRMYELINEIKIDGGSLDVPGFDKESLDLLTSIDIDSIDEKITQYGNLPTDVIDEISETKPQVSIENKEIVLDNDKIKIEQETPTEVAKPYVECPKCGEKVWL